MPDLRLISHHLCPYVQRAVIVLSEKNIPHERTYIDLANKPEWFRRLSPLGRVPVLQAGTSVVFESQVIVEYLDEVTDGSLHPTDPLEKARHRSWIEFGSGVLNGISAFYNASDTRRFQETRAVLRAKFERIEHEITGPFFAGEVFHLVDGAWGPIFRYFDVFDQIEDFGVLSGLDKVQRWRAALEQRPSVVNAPPDGYPERLGTFLKKRESCISTLMDVAA